MALKRRTSLKFSAENGDTSAVAENAAQNTQPQAAPSTSVKEKAEAAKPQPTEEENAATSQAVLDNISRQVAQQMQDETEDETPSSAPVPTEEQPQPQEEQGVEAAPATEEFEQDITEPPLPQGLDIKPEPEQAEDTSATEEEKPRRRSGLDDLLEDDEPEEKPEKTEKAASPIDQTAQKEPPKSREERASNSLKSAMSALMDDDDAEDTNNSMPAMPTESAEKAEEPPAPTAQEETAADDDEDDLPPPPAGTVAPMPPIGSDKDDDNDDDDLDDLPPPPWEAVTKSIGSTLPPSVESLMGNDDDIDDLMPDKTKAENSTDTPAPAASTAAAAPAETPAPAAPKIDPNDDWDIADLIDFAPKPGATPQPVAAPSTAPSTGAPPPPTAAETQTPPPPPPNSNAGGPTAPPKKNVGTPPWATPSYDPPPELPGDDLSTRKGGSNAPKATRSSDSALMRNIMVFGLAGVVIFMAYLMFFKNNEKTNERLARITGTLNEVSQEIPTEGDEDSFNSIGGVRAENQVPMPDLDAAAQEETQIEFLEPPEDASSAEGEETVDKSLFASLQDAIIKAREQKNQTDSAKLNTEEETLDPTRLSREERVARDAKIRAELEDELAAYRRALTNTPNPALRPGPDEFFSSRDREQGTLQPPSIAEQNALRQDAALAPNPNNLPVIAPPEMPDQGQLGVRTLNDFDVSMFEPPRGRVRMPEQVRPRINPVAFPKVILLSLVPNRGIIAQTADKEGVLLIGETIEGWELVAVYDQYAEFRTGQRKHILTFDN